MRSAVEVCRGKALVVAGSGTNCTETTIAATRDVLAWGADVAMLITPYYNKPQQHGLRAHYRAVARAVDIPIMLYNVPGRTACNLLPATVTELAAEPNIVAVKEASGNLDQMERVIAETGLQVFSGDDGLNFQIYGLGARGTVSVVSNLLPGAVVRTWTAWRDGDIATAWKLSRLLDPTARACFVETSPAPVKELLALAGLCRREQRLPLMPVTEDSLKYLVQFYESTLATSWAATWRCVGDRRHGARRRGPHGPAGDRARRPAPTIASWPPWSPSRAAAPPGDVPSAAGRGGAGELADRAPGVAA